MNLKNGFPLAFAHLFPQKTVVNPNSMNKNNHLNTKNQPLSNYEMFVRMAPGSKYKTFTYRGDKTLSYYRSLGAAFQRVTTELQALITKMQNCDRFQEVTIYDNTGEIPRRVIFKMTGGVIETNLITK